MLFVDKKNTWFLKAKHFYGKSYSIPCWRFYCTAYFSLVVVLFLGNAQIFSMVNVYIMPIHVLLHIHRHIAHLIADGLVTVCVDYVKGKCVRETCKYFHPPEHLVAQLKAVKAQSAAAAAQVFSNTAATIQYSPSTIQFVHPITMNSSQPILAASSTTYAYPQQTSTARASSSPLVCFMPLARFISALIKILFFIYFINLINHIILTNITTYSFLLFLLAPAKCT